MLFEFHREESTAGRIVSTDQKNEKTKEKTSLKSWDNAWRGKVWSLCN
jgi:hypothetical protein